MRDYAKVGPQFWIGKTGKKLRAAGAEAQIVGMYLMTSPHANMLGLYYVSKNSIAHETGLREEGASKGLLSCIEADFCSYDEESEMIWVHEMAAYQIAEALVATDKRCAGVQNEYNTLPDNPYLARFFDKYQVAFNMTKKRGIAGQQAVIEKAPSKPLGSQEQEQEQEQELKAFVPSDAGDQIISAPAKPDCPHKEIIALYHEVLPQCPQIRDWTPARATQLRARWNEDASRQNLGYWRRFFEYVASCDFLVGRTGKTPFFADLEWMTKSANFTKIREAKYANKEAA